MAERRAQISTPRRPEQDAPACPGPARLREEPGFPLSEDHSKTPQPARASTAERRARISTLRRPQQDAPASPEGWRQRRSRGQSRILSLPSGDKTIPYPKRAPQRPLEEQWQGAPTSLSQGDIPVVPPGSWKSHSSMGRMPPDVDKRQVGGCLTAFSLFNVLFVMFSFYETTL